MEKEKNIAEELKEIRLALEDLSNLIYLVLSPYGVTEVEDGKLSLNNNTIESNVELYHNKTKNYIN